MPNSGYQRGPILYPKKCLLFPRRAGRVTRDTPVIRGSQNTGEQRSGIFRRYDELFPGNGVGLGERERHRRLELFTAFLDTRLRTLDGAPDIVGKSCTAQCSTGNASGHFSRTLFVSVGGFFGKRWFDRKPIASPD